jgi:nitrous oxide reductase
LTIFEGFRSARWALVAIAAVLAGCAGMGGLTEASPAEEKRAQVLARADARGAALVAGKLDEAYAFLSEGSKAVITKENFSRRMSIVPFTAYRIDTASCEGSTCKVQSKLTFNHRVMQGVTTPVTETWVIENGQPYFVFPAQ